MSLKSEIEAIVRESNENLSARIMKVLGRASIGDLIKVTGGKIGGARAAAESRPAATKTESAKSTKGAKGAGKKSSKKSEKVAEKPAAKKGAAKKSSGRAPSAEETRAIVFGDLRANASERVRANDIIDRGRAAGKRLDGASVGRVLRELLALGYIHKSGNTRATTYQITSDGLSGEFPKAPSSVSKEPTESSDAAPSSDGAESSEAAAAE